jgi:hypothetical protein
MKPTIEPKTNSSVSPLRLAITLGVALGLGASNASHAQGNGITATGTLTDVPGAGNTYDYTLTVNNSASSLNPIGSFWYAWVPGEFFLPTQPSSEGAPANWTANPFTALGASSIQFSTSTTGAKIAPGGSLSFTFVSTDTPTVLAGNAPNHPGTPIGTTVAYAGALQSDSGDTFVVNSIVPEPSTLALIGLGGLGLVGAGWRRRVTA